MVELLSNIFDSIFKSKFSPMLGSLVVLWIGYRLYASKSSKDLRVQEFNKSASDFRNMFEGIKATINQNPELTGSQIADQILKVNYSKQSIAMKDFKRQMRFFKRIAFSKAWKKYVNPENCGDEPFLSYQGIPWEIEKSYGRQYILDTIEHLLTFAKK